DLAATARSEGQACADGVAVGAGGGSFELKGDEVPGRPLVVEIGQGLAIGDDQQVEPAVVVKVAGGQATTDPGDLPRRAGAPGHVGKPAGALAQEELRRHGVGTVGPEVADVAVGRGQVEPTVVVGIQEGRAEAQQVAAGCRQADRRGAVQESPGPEV